MLLLTNKLILMKTKLSPIQKRLLRHFANNNTLSIKNMWLVRISNASREVSRNFEIPFGIKVNKKIITWKENGENGYYAEYSIDTNNLPKLQKLCKENGILIW